MQQYDLLFIKGDTVNSRIIKFITRSPYSHVAIVLDNYHVMETDIRYPLQIRHTSYPINSFDVYRFHRELTDNEKSLMDAYLMEKLQTKYDIARTISNGLFLLFNIPIRNAVKRLNCTEVAFDMYKAAGIDLGAELTPRDLSTSSKLFKVQV